MFPEGWLENCDFEPGEGQWCFDVENGRTVELFTDLGCGPRDSGTYYIYYDGIGPFWTGKTFEDALSGLRASLKGVGVKLRQWHPPVVFADIDGVLNHNRIYAECREKAGKTIPSDWLDPECIANLNRLCERSGAVIVISSGWRKYLNGHANVAKVLQEKGLTATVIGETPDLGEDSNRWLEIAAWLQTNPRVTKFVVLDDSCRTVTTTMENGLTHEKALEAESVLNSNGV